MHFYKLKFPTANKRRVGGGSELEAVDFRALGYPTRDKWVADLMFS